MPVHAGLGPRRWILDRGNEKAGRLAALGCGSLLSSAYVVWIGGDYLLGRFWVGAVFIAMIVTAATVTDFVAWMRSATWPLRVTVMAALAALLVGAPAAARSIATAIDGKRIWKISIARDVLQDDLSWSHSKWPARMVEQARDIRDRAARENRSVVEWDVVGIAGFQARELRLVDTYGLVDPLVARLSPKQIRKAGHLPRSIPAGYLVARESGSLAEMDPALAEYYRPLRLIVSSPLLNLERLRTIVRFNLGAFDHHREDYEKRMRGEAEAAAEGRIRTR